MVKEILLTLFYLFFFNFLIYRFTRFQFRNFKPVITHIIFNLKFLVGILIWCIYTFYYKGVQNNDVHKFYTDALVLRNVANENPQAFITLLYKNDAALSEYTAPMKNWVRNFDEAPFNENQTIIRLNAVLMFVSLKTYFVHILFFCFLSLIGWLLLTNSILSFTDEKNSILALPVLLLPSVLFWTSGVMKEPLLVLGLGLLISGILDFGFRNTDLKTGVKILIGFLVILLTKFFVLACLLPAVVAFLLFPKNENPVFVWSKYLVVTVVMLLVAFNIHSLVPRINLLQMLVNKQTNSIKEAEYFKAGSRIEIPALKNNVVSILKTAVLGIWNTLFRPYVWETKNVMMLMSAAENIIVLTFLIGFISASNWSDPKNINLFLLLTTFSLSYFALVGMCTPVLGNLVRYRTPLLPIFLFAFIIKVSPKAVADSLSFVLRK